MITRVTTARKKVGRSRGRSAVMRIWCLRTAGRRRPVEVGERHPLQVAEQERPEVVLRGTWPEILRRSMPRPMRTSAMSTTAPTSGRERIAVARLEHVVDHPAGQVWQGDGARHQRRDTQGGDGDLALVRAEEAEESEQDRQGDLLVNGSGGPMAVQGPGALLEEGLPPSPASPLAVAVPNVSAVAATRRWSPRSRTPAGSPAPRSSTSAPTPTRPQRADRGRRGALALQDALVGLAGECLERIDLRRHQGVHPRVGALDVAPIVALDDEDVPLACEIATGLAGRLGEELNLPVFLYGEVATDPDRTLPRDFRRGGLEEARSRDRGGRARADHGPPPAPDGGRRAGGRAPADRPQRLAAGRDPHRRPPSPPACARPAAGRQACGPSASTCPRPGWRGCR